jgi:hypothetical protein
MPGFLRPSIDPPALLDVALDENGFVDWLVDAEAGDHVVYYRGHLAFDRCESGRIGDAKERQRLVNIARRVMAATDQGLVHPVQKRLGPDDVLYIAVRASGRRRIATKACPAPTAPALAFAA